MHPRWFWCSKKAPPGVWSLPFGQSPPTTSLSEIIQSLDVATYPSYPLQFFNYRKIEKNIVPNISFKKMGQRYLEPEFPN